MSKTKKLAVSTLVSFALAWFATSLYGQNGVKIKRVLVISFDGMHSIDFGLWIKNNPGSNIAQLASQGTNFTNASSTKPSDSIPSTVGAFTGASAALGGMYQAPDKYTTVATFAGAKTIAVDPTTHNVYLFQPERGPAPAPPAGAAPPATGGRGRGPQGPILAAWFIVIKQ